MQRASHRDKMGPVFVANQRFLRESTKNWANLSMSDRLSVLLIEDDIIDAERVERSFAMVSTTLFELTHVPRFLDAIQAIKKQQFHVVILDLGLPDSSGLNGVKKLMELIPSIPVIVLTGHSDEDEALAGIELGAQEFIDKNSVAPGVLVRSIRHAIKRKQYAIQQQSKTGQDTAEAKQLGRLAEIVRETSDAVSSSVGSLMNTELSDQQKSLVSNIKKKTEESLRAAADLSPPEPMFVEADDHRSGRHRPA
tara:strand:- start:108982 stop:109737 length:756 start_codon:yes stop_codon:yes gene_type:complete